MSSWHNEHPELAGTDADPWMANPGYAAAAREVQMYQQFPNIDAMIAREEARVRIDEVEVGQEVKAKGTGEEGTVRRIDYEDHVIWVEFPVANRDHGDMLDLDPDDLERV
jgi:hypothetical protein